MNKICFVRFDDVCPTMDIENFGAAFGLMDKYGIKPLLGVIPDNQDPAQICSDPLDDYWNYLKNLQSKGYTIAMHGFTHVYDMENPKTLICGRKHSEFAGHDYQEQLHRIQQGKAILKSHGIETDVFFAPAHSYDKNTLKALRDSGFKYLSDGYSSRPYKRYGIICVPCRSFGIPQKIRGKYCTVVAHPGEWRLGNGNAIYAELDAFCKDHFKEIVSFDDIKKHRPGIAFFQRLNESFFSLARSLKQWLRRASRK